MFVPAVERLTADDGRDGGLSFFCDLADSLSENVRFFMSYF